MPVCNVCDGYFTGPKCRCGASAETGSDGRGAPREPTVNYCEWESCGIPCSIGSTKDFHLPRLCPWHREIERLEPATWATANTFERFQAWRKDRVVNSPIADQTAWDAVCGRRKLTYRSVRR